MATDINKIVLLRSAYGDWVGVYVNGDLIDEGHSINFYKVMTSLGYPVESIEKSEEWFDEHGGMCPDRWEES